MAPYSLDLRQKVLQAYERGAGSQRQLAELFGVSLGFVERLFKQWRETGHLAPKPHAGGKASKLDAPARQRLVGWLRAQPDLTLAELLERLDRELNIRLSDARLSVVLRAMGWPRKKSRSMPANATRPR